MQSISSMDAEEMSVFKPSSLCMGGFYDAFHAGWSTSSAPSLRLGLKEAKRIDTDGQDKVCYVSFSSLDIALEKKVIHFSSPIIDTANPLRSAGEKVTSPHRLEAEDISLSRRKRGFEFPWG